MYYEPTAEKADISKWFLANRVPTTVELHQETFQQVMNAPHKPLVVIAAVNDNGKEKVAEKMKEIGKKWRVWKDKGSRDVIFTWMDTDKWASWLKSMYGVKVTEEPTVIIADHSVRVPGFLVPIMSTDLLFQCRGCRITTRINRSKLSN